MVTSVPRQSVGIEFGMTNSSIARIDDHGHPVTVPDSHGWNWKPSVVLLGDDGKVVVSPSLERTVVEDPANVIETIKRQFGNPDWFKEYQGHKLTPEFVAALILKDVQQNAAGLVDPNANVVLAVPESFDGIQQRAMHNAGRIAGMRVIGLITEQAAAALYYFWQQCQLSVRGFHEYLLYHGAKQTDHPRYLLVFTLGGRCFNVSVMRFNSAKLEMIATRSDLFLGGHDWTSLLRKHASEQFALDFCDHDPRTDNVSWLMLNDACETAKQKLSTESSAKIGVEFRGKSRTISLTQEAFEQMTSELLEQTWDATISTLQQANLGSEHLEAILLVGGATQMPAVTRMFERRWNRSPATSVDPTAVVSLGAAIHAALLEMKWRNTDSELG
jgi:molecular chaperone DnaK